MQEEHSRHQNTEEENEERKKPKYTQKTLPQNELHRKEMNTIPEMRKQSLRNRVRRATAIATAT